MNRAEGKSRISAGDILLLLWIVGTGAFYFLRMGFTFYQANQVALQGFIDRFYHG